MGDGYGRTRIEREHGDCADILMSDYGIPRRKRIGLCHEIAKVWIWDLMFHDLIVGSIRGWYNPVNPRQVEGLRQYLERHKTHAPKNHNPNQNLSDRL